MSDDDEALAEAARLRAARDRKGKRDGDVPLGRRLGQIGVLGWLVVLPALGGAALGRWLDGLSGGGVFFTAPLLFGGIGIGCWIAWRWVNKV